MKKGTVPFLKGLSDNVGAVGRDRLPGRRPDRSNAGSVPPF